MSRFAPNLAASATPNNNNNNSNISTSNQQQPPYSIGAHSMASRSPDPYGNTNNQLSTNQHQQHQTTRDRSQSQQSFGNALESQGLTSSAVELGLLQSKLRSAHSELQRTRSELKSETERASTLSSQLNQQKVENSTLTHQYSAVLAKLTDAESEKNRYEEEIRSERDSHQSTRETLDSERNLSSQREASLNQHINALENKLNHLQQQLADQQENGVAGGSNKTRNLFNNQQHQDPHEAMTIHDRYVRLTEVLTNQMDSTLEQLLVQFAEDDVFVINSMCRSTANEVEARIATTEMKIKDALSASSQQREIEDQVVAFASSLLHENKELWNNISRLQSDLELSNRDLDELRDRERGLTEAAPLREHIAYLEQQNAALEEDTRAVRQVVDEQKEREREHEAAARRLMEELKTLTQKYEHLQDDRSSLQRVLDEACSTATEATAECEQLREQNTKHKKEIEQLKSNLDTIEHEHRTETDLQLNELIEKVRVAQQERNEAQKDADHHRFLAEELEGRNGEYQRELENRDDEIARLRREVEDTKQQCLATLETEIVSQKNMYERELAELRDKIDELSSRDRAPPGMVEDLQNEVARLEQELDMERSSNREKDQDILDLRDQIRALANERDQATERERDAVQRAQASQRESERIQNEMQRLAAAVEAESGRHGSKLQAAEDEVNRLQEQVGESERHRQQVMEELRITRQSIRGAAVNDDALRQLREKFDRDRHELIQENERLQVQLKSLNQKYIEAMEHNRSISAINNPYSRDRDLSIPKNDPRELSNLQARLEGQNRKNVELEKRRDELENDKRKLQEHVRQLQQEKQVLETRMDHIVNQIRKEQELDLGAPMKSAMTQHRRLNDQIGEMDNLINQSRQNSLAPPPSSSHQQQRTSSSNNINQPPQQQSSVTTTTTTISSSTNNTSRRPPPSATTTTTSGAGGQQQQQQLPARRPPPPASGGGSGRDWRP